MPSFSHLPLQQAVYAALSGDSTLMGLVSAVYDFVPEYPAYPYVTLGEAAGRDSSNLAVSGIEYVLTLRVFSRQAGRTEAAGIMARVYQLLHEASLSVSGQTLVFLRYAASRVLLQADGLTYQGIMQFNAMLQSE